MLFAGRRRCHQDTARLTGGQAAEARQFAQFTIAVRREIRFVDDFQLHPETVTQVYDVSGDGGAGAPGGDARVLADSVPAGGLAAFTRPGAVEHGCAEAWEYRSESLGVGDESGDALG